MTTLFYILGYLAVIGFIALACLHIKKYVGASPLHVRWELYPVPHEGARKEAYGGSFMEETEWWSQSRHVEHWGDIKGILEEVLCLKATLEHNPKLWFRTYPFHFGMYMLMGGTIILIFASLLLLVGVSAENGFMIFLSNVINAVVLVGGCCIVGGGVALIHRRLTDEGLKKFTGREHFVNLGSFVCFGLLTLAAWAFNPSYFDLASAFVVNLITFSFQPVGSFFFGLNMLFGFLVLILIPTTNMKHLILKYFMYHDIRWGDTPTPYSEKNQKSIGDLLQLKPTWSADHIRGDGSKTWVDVATDNPSANKN